MIDDFPMELITGIDKIDLQHMEFIARVKMLHESFLNGTNTEKLLETFNYIKCYIIGHFAAEEKMMLELGYPNYKRHANAHKVFIEDYSNLEKTFKQDGLSSDLKLDFNVQLINWITSHIMDEDILMAEFIRQSEEAEKLEKKLFNHG